MNTFSHFVSWPAPYDFTGATEKNIAGAVEYFKYSAFPSTHE
jgi:hypothetical protein